MKKLDELIGTYLLPLFGLGIIFFTALSKRWEHGIMIYGVLGIYSIIKLIIANVFWSKQFKQEMKATLIYTSIGVLFVLYYVFG